ncbi:MAG: aldehyde dehydrogenase family protein [Phycisphaerales bacterium]|nr:aldehyde dehydrogenase family protein [Phycisphaerales bacterium]
MPPETTINRNTLQKSRASTASPAAADPVAPESGVSAVSRARPLPVHSATGLGDPDPPGSSKRRAWARRFGRLVAADLDVLSSLAEAEIGKPRWETITAELMPLVASCRWHARRSGRLLKDRRLAGRPWWLLGQQALVRRVPLGRVGIIGTWNYPIQLLGIQIVQAVVAGNRVVVKPSERSPGTQRRLVELAHEAGLSPSELVVTSSERAAGGRLLEEPDLDHVVFTGSTEIGTRVAESAAGRLLPTTLELSGCDSAILLDDADPVVAARSIWAAVTMNAGQTCMAPRRVLVHADRHADFAAALVPLAAGAGMRDVIDVPAAERHRRLVEDAITRGGRPAALVADSADGRRVRPQAILDCPLDAEAFDAEHFGPLLVVRAWRSEEELLAMHRRGGKHLATSVFSANRRRVDRLVPALGGGLVTINDCVIPTAHPAATLSPVGGSGWGSSRGTEGLLAMTRPVVVARTGRWRIPAGEPDARSKRMLEGMVRRWGRGVTPPPDSNRANSNGS